MAVIFVHDTSKLQTYINIELWLNEANKYINNDTIRMLCGNKIDLDKIKQVDANKAEKFAELNNMLFMETSALTSENVDNMMQLIAVSIYFLLLLPLMMITLHNK